MCYYNSDCGYDEYCCSGGYCCYDSYSTSTFGSGSIVGLVVGLIILKILIISCIVYYRRRRATGYFVAPNTATVATVVQTNQAAQPQMHPQMVAQPYYPAAAPTVQVQATAAKPPAYADAVSPSQV